MAEKAELTLKLEAELRDAFLAEVMQADRSPAEVLGEMMQEFIERQRAGREHDAFVRRKVELARISARSGLGRPDGEVEAEFLMRRVGANADS